MAANSEHLCFIMKRVSESNNNLCFGFHHMGCSAFCVCDIHADAFRVVVAFHYRQSLPIKNTVPALDLSVGILYFGRCNMFISEFISAFFLIRQIQASWLPSIYTSFMFIAKLQWCLSFLSKKACSRKCGFL